MPVQGSWGCRWLLYLKGFQQLKSIEGQLVLPPLCGVPGDSPNCGSVLTNQLVWLEDAVMFCLMLPDSAESTRMVYSWKTPELSSELPHQSTCTDDKKDSKAASQSLFFQGDGL